MPPHKPKPVENLSELYEPYLLPLQVSEILNVMYASTVTSISEIPKIMSLWGNTEEGMLHPEEIQEEATLFTRFTELLGPYFFQYREFPVIEYLLNIFLEQGQLPQLDYFRPYMPDKSPEERLELIHLLDQLFRNALGSYRGSSLHFLDVVTPILISNTVEEDSDLLEHVPTYSAHQRTILVQLMTRQGFTTLGQYFMVDDATAERFTPAQSAFLGELINNGKMEDYQEVLLADLALNPELNLTEETAVRILQLWLLYMVTSEFPEGILINANNASKIFFSDNIVYDGITLIRNWFQISQNGLPRVITEGSLKEADVYIKLKWRLDDLEVMAGLRDPLPPAEYDPLNDWGEESEFASNGERKPLPENEMQNKEVHLMVRTREDQMVRNSQGGYDMFDRKTGAPEEADTVAAEIADFLTLIAGDLLAYSGYAKKPKGKMFYVEIYANQIPELRSRLAHIGIELNEQGTGFEAVNRTITPEQMPERMRLLSLFAYNFVAHKEKLKSPLTRQKLSLAPSPTTLLDKKVPRDLTPKKKRKRKGDTAPPPAKIRPMVQKQLF